MSFADRYVVEKGCSLPIFLFFFMYVLVKFIKRILFPNIYRCSWTPNRVVETKLEVKS